MKRFLFVLCALSTFAIGCSDSETSTGGGDPRTTGILALTGDSGAGQVNFETSCGLGSTCHNPDGTSNGDAADLTEVTSMLSDEQVVTVIVKGVGSMPAQGGLADQKIADILAYMRASWGG